MPPGLVGWALTDMPVRILVSDPGYLDSFSAGKQTQRRTLVVPFSLSLYRLSMIGVGDR